LIGAGRRRLEQLDTPDRTGSQKNPAGAGAPFAPTEKPEQVVSHRRKKEPPAIGRRLVSVVVNTLT
jgi:hypothetical protein